MNELPRFEPIQDARPADEPWLAAIWPIAPGVALRGETVELTSTTLGDAPELFNALADDRAWQHVSGRPEDEAGMRALLQQRLADANWHCWTVRLISALPGVPSGSVVGTTSFLDTLAGSARTELGATQYSPKVWASKVNPECKLALLSYAFDELHMGRVQLKTDVRNVRSQQAIARLGARYEGVLRRYQRRTDGSVRDTVMFSIIAEDWPEVRTRLTGRLADPGSR